MNLNDKEKEMVRNWRNNDVVRKWCYLEHIISVEEHYKFMKKLEEDNQNFYWLAESKNEYIGVVSFNRVDFKNKNAYLGIYSNPQLKGMGSLLMECLKRIAFDIVHLHTLKLDVLKDNKKAISFFEKSGFKKEGMLKEFVYKEGKYKNVVVMGLINKYENKNLQ